MASSPVDDVYIAPSANRLELHTGFDVISMVGTQNGSSAQQPLGLTVGANYSRELLGHFGLGLGLDYVSRKVMSSNDADVMSANYIDIIYSGSYTQTADLAWISSVTTFFGGFSAIPNGRMSGGDEYVSTRTSEGIYLSVSGRVPLEAPIDFGLNMWTKWGLTRAFGDNTGFDKLFSSGIGISAIY